MFNGALGPVKCLFETSHADMQVGQAVHGARDGGVMAAGGVAGEARERGSEEMVGFGKFFDGNELVAFLDIQIGYRTTCAEEERGVRGGAGEQGKQDCSCLQARKGIHLQASRRSGARHFPFARNSLQQGG